LKVLFIYNGAENLGIEYISSFLKSKGHETLLLFDPAVFSGHVFVNSKFFSSMFSLDKEIIRKSIEIAPDLIAFSAFTGNYRWCLEIARNIKTLVKTPIVFGGVHVTAVPENILSNDFIDYAIVGEGEKAMLDLVEHIERGGSENELLNIPNLCFRHEGNFHRNTLQPYIQDMDSLPFLDKDLFYDKVPMMSNNYMAIASRGCPYSCTYCSNDLFHDLYSHEKKHIRKRSPENVIEELKQAKDKWDIRFIKFVDDVFTLSRSWLEQFIPLYKSEINIPFFCSVHPATISKNTALLLKEGGCYLITMGIQSGSERIRKRIFNRTGSNEKILDSVRAIKDAGILLSVDYIFGAPTETKEDLDQSLEFYRKVNADRIVTFSLTYYPKTQIIHTANKLGWLSKNDINNINEGIIGYTHGTGSISQENVNLYLNYQLLYQLRTLFHNDKLYSFFSPIVSRLPFKGLVKNLIIFLNGLKNRDINVYYLFKYIWTPKNVP